MRIALLSPYSWTYPGGVTRHVKALTECYMAEGHFVRVLAPYDPPGRFSAVLHRGARPPVVPAPDYLIPLGRTVGLPANGSVSNVSVTPFAVATALTELRTGHYDVVHIHEAMSPVAPWAVTDLISLPKVGTFHTYNENPVTNRLASLIGARRMLNRLHVRIAVSEASAWTAQRYLGGHYRIIPNGVWVDSERAERAAGRPMGEKLKILFVGQAVERKGLPVLIRAFEALRDHIPCELTVIGPSDEELKPLLLDPTGVRNLGKLSDEEKWDELEQADVLCAPSLRGESFGLVLTEAFANGTPVVASDIVGYRDVVQNGVDGVLVPPGDAQALAETLRELYHQPEVRTSMARAAARNVERFAWPHVAEEVLGGLRGRDRDAGAREPAQAARRQGGDAGRRSQAPRSGSADGQPAAQDDRGQARPGHGAGSPFRARCGEHRGRRPGHPGAREDRDRERRLGARGIEPQLRGPRPGHHVRGHGGAGHLLARDSGGGAARTHACVYPTPCRGRSSASSCPRRCRPGSASPPAPWWWRGEPANRARTSPWCWGRWSPRRFSTSSRW